MEEESKVIKQRSLTPGELDKIVTELFPWGSVKVEDSYIGPVPGRRGYNIMGLNTFRCGEEDAVIELVLYSTTEDDIDDKDLLGFYVGVMSYIFPELECCDETFDPDTMNVLNFYWREEAFRSNDVYGWCKKRLEA